MTQAESRSLPPDVEAVREQIEEWRRTRSKRTRMPERLWEAAVSLARKHGMWRISQDLRVRFEGLKSRMAPAEPSSKAKGKAEFVELTSALTGAGSGNGATSVEVSRADGTRLSLRLGAGGDVDLQALVGAFCQQSR